MGRESAAAWGFRWRWRASACRIKLGYPANDIARHHQVAFRAMSVSRVCKARGNGNAMLPDDVAYVFRRRRSVVLLQNIDVFVRRQKEISLEKQEGCRRE